MGRYDWIDKARESLRAGGAAFSGTSGGHEYWVKDGRKFSLPTHPKASDGMQRAIVSRARRFAAGDGRRSG